MKRCIKCFSYAFNLYKEDIDQGDLCDVHYWKEKAMEAQQEQRSDRASADSEQLGEPVAYLVTGPYEKQPFANINSAKAYREGLNKGFGEDAYTISNLYTTPQQPSTIVRTAAEGEDTRSSAATPCRAWVGLTDEEVVQYQQGNIYHFYRCIEAKLKEKNSA